MAYNLKKINDDKYEYKNPKGEIKYFTKANLEKFVAAGKEILVDNQKYISSTNPSTSTPTASQSTSSIKNNFISTDGENFSFQGKTYPKKIIISNLIKGASIYVNSKKVVLTSDKTDFVFEDGSKLTKKTGKKINFTTEDNINYIYKGKKYTKQAIIKTIAQGNSVTINDSQYQLTPNGKDIEKVTSPEQSLASVGLNQENMLSITANSPVNTTQSLAYKITQDPQGKFWFKSSEKSRKEIVATLRHGKDVTINGKLIVLTPDRKDFVYAKVEKAEPTNSKEFHFKTVAENSYYYAPNNSTFNRTNIVSFLKKPLIVFIDNRRVVLTPDKLDFCFEDEYEQLIKNLKSFKDVKDEYAKQDVDIVVKPNKLPSYFNSGVSPEDLTHSAGERKDDTISAQKMRELQKRLFQLSGDSNMINIDSDKNLSTFDFVAFINEYIKATNAPADILKKMFAGESIIFDFSKETEPVKKLWTRILKFYSAVQDTFKEMGDDYLNVGFPTVQGLVTDQSDKLHQQFPILAPLFFVKTKLIINNKDKTLSFILSRDRQQLEFVPNTELILYLATKKNKIIDLSKYKVLFSKTGASIGQLITSMCEFFKELQINLPSQMITEVTQKYIFETLPVVQTPQQPQNPQQMGQQGMNQFGQQMGQFNQQGQMFNQQMNPNQMYGNQGMNQFGQQGQTFGPQNYSNQGINNSQQPQQTYQQPLRPEFMNTRNFCFMGIFKTLNSEIFRDYDKILESQTGKDYWNKLESLIPDQLKYYKDKGEDFKEQEIRQIVPLDYSQKVACKLAITNSINIVGPAGTGKSQTISNILANFIDKHESALFVAEKKTATDVVFNRLRNLRYYCLPLFDKENWNEALTKQLKVTLKRVGQIYGSWKALNLDSDENKQEFSSIKLDKQFEDMNTFRQLMSSQKGFDLPKLTIEFSSPKKHKMLKDVENLVQSIFDASSTSGEFWEQINKTKNEKILFEGCMSMLDSITDPEIMQSKDLKNRFLKICKYYDSPTLYDNEMVQILQAPDYDDKPLDPNIKIENNGELKSYKQTDPIYKKIQSLVSAKITSHNSTMNDIKKHEGFVTIDYLESLRSKIYRLSGQQQPVYNQPVGNNIQFGQQMGQFNQQGQMFNQQMNPNQMYGQQMPQQQGFNPYQQQLVQQQKPVGQQNTQTPQQPQNPQQMGQQGVNQFGQQMGQFNQQGQMFNQQMNQNQMYGQQMPQQQGFNPYQQVPQQAGNQTPAGMQNGMFNNDDPTYAFSEMYNQDIFDFEQVKYYYDLKYNFKQGNQIISSMDSAKWLNETNDLLAKKLKSDLTFSELNFLKYIKEQIDKDTTYYAQYNKLYGLVDNCEKLTNVEDTLDRFGNIIYLLYPIVIASPNLVSKYINAAPELFDHVVIDEASMLSLEKAVPILYRGKTFCIVGDSKQLQPLTYLEQLKKLKTYNKLYLEGKMSSEDLGAQQKLVNEYKGVLDFIGSKIQKTTLQYHYRAVKKELVHFSSIAFYDNEMIVANNYTDKEIYNDCGVVVHQVNGEYHKGINEKECLALYKELERIAKINKTVIAAEDKISVGIIVFTAEQKDYLNNLISSQADPDVLNMQVLYDSSTGEDNSLFIKDVESVQGDERDVILMSLGSSTLNKAEMVSSFGLLNTSLGPNFLNVMTTRARKCLEIFKSFKSEDIPNTGNNAINVYKDFIKYIDLLSLRNPEKTKSEIDNLFKEYLLKSATIDYSTLDLSMHESYLTKELFKKFSAHIDHDKYIVKKDYPTIQGQTFGLVAIDRKNNIPEFAIMFDEFMKNLYKTPKQSEFYDYLFLKSRGWKFNKVNALEWSTEINKHIDKPNFEELMNEYIKSKLTFGLDCYYIEKNAHEYNDEEESKTKQKPSLGIAELFNKPITDEQQNLEDSNSENIESENKGVHKSTSKSNKITKKSSIKDKPKDLQQKSNKKIKTPDNKTLPQKTNKNKKPQKNKSVSSKTVIKKTTTKTTTIKSSVKKAKPKQTKKNKK